MKIKKYIFEILSTTLSLVAIFLSWKSNSEIKHFNEYSIQRDRMLYTPALKMEADSNTIQFKLNDQNSELQQLTISFPKEISDRKIEINNLSLTIGRSFVQNLAKGKIKKLIPTNDSTYLVGTYSLPVMIDYNTITYGYPQNLRENRFLTFDFYTNNEKITATFRKAILIQRFGIPMKSHWFYTGFLSSPLENRIYKADEKDVEALLSNELHHIDESTLSMLK